MGKIFNALDKYRKERKVSGLPRKMKPSDWRVLQTYDRATGKLDINNPNLSQEALKRLQFYRLIQNDGTLTPAGLAKSAELNQPAEDSRNQEQIVSNHMDGRKEKLVPVDGPVSDISDIESAMFKSGAEEVDRGPLESDWDHSLKRSREANYLLQDDTVTSQMNPNRLEIPKDSDSSLKSKTDSPPKKQPAEDISASPEMNDRTISIVKPHQAKVHLLKESRPTIGEQNEDLISVYDAPESVEEVKPADLVPFDEPAPVSSDVNAIDKKLIALLKPQSFEAEQFKILRTNLLYPTSGNAPRSVIVTSALPGEGKSFVSANLAVSVASDIDRHVLLIDCDLRSPSLHSIFGFKGVPGLSDYLAKGVPLTSLLLRTNVDKLTILPAGPPPSNPAELLSSEKMSAMLREVYERYGDRMIIIDTPPPQLTAETKALANKVDGIVLVIKFGSTPRDSVTELIARLGEKKIIGSIINDFDLRAAGYYGKHYGKYYGK